MTSQTVNTRVESVNNVPQVEFQDNGTDIVFTSNDKVEQTIGIKLALIPINTDDLLNDVISADPSIKNVPPQ